MTKPKGTPRYGCCGHCTHSPLPPGYHHYDPCGKRCSKGSKPLTIENGAATLR